MVVCGGGNGRGKSWLFKQVRLNSRRHGVESPGFESVADRGLSLTSPRSAPEKQSHQRGEEPSRHF